MTTLDYLGDETWLGNKPIQDNTRQWTWYNKLGLESILVKHSNKTHGYKSECSWRKLNYHKVKRNWKFSFLLRNVLVAEIWRVTVIELWHLNLRLYWIFFSFSLLNSESRCCGNFEDELIIPLFILFSPWGFKPLGNFQKSVSKHDK